MASFEREKHYLNHGFCKYEIFQNNILFYCEMYLYNMTYIATVLYASTMNKYTLLLLT